MSNGTLRILTALVGIPLIVIPTWYGGIWFELLVGLIAVGAQVETYRLFRRVGYQPAVVPGLLLGLLILVRFRLPYSEWLAIVLVLYLLMDLLRIAPSSNALARVAATLFGVVYPVWLLSFLSRIRLDLGFDMASVDAFALTMLLFVIIWTSDTFAYYIGRSFGRHPLAPRISPKKTVEGSVGGFGGALLVCVLAMFTFLPFLSWIDVFALSLIGGVVGQAGDLMESAIKRSADTKDSAGFLPGHGGLLDRFDALIVAAPLYWLYLNFAMSATP